MPWLSLVTSLLCILALGNEGAPARSSARDTDGDPLPQGARSRLGGTLWRTPNEILSVAFGEDGRWAAAVQLDQQVICIDLSSGRVLPLTTVVNDAPP